MAPRGVIFFDIHLAFHFSDVNDVLDSIPQEEREKRLDIEFWYFLLNEIEKLEKEYLLESLSKKQDIIRAQHLMEKWDMDEFEIYTIASQKGWDFVDPLGTSIGHEFLLAMCAHGNFSISEAFFRKSDAEEYEKENLTQYSKTDEILVDSLALKNETTVKKGVPVTSFYKNGQIWEIGPKVSIPPFPTIIFFSLQKKFSQKKFCCANRDCCTL
jgi:hypothetical protein